MERFRGYLYGSKQTDEDGNPIIDKRTGKQKESAPWRAVLVEYIPNPKYTPKPDGEDTRLPSEKRRKVTRQMTRVFGADVRTKSDANRALAVWKAEMESEDERKAEAEDEARAVPTVAEFVQRYLDTQPISDSTMRGYRVNAKHLSKEFAGVTLDELTAQRVTDWVVRVIRGNEYSKSTRTKDLNFLSMVCDLAVEEGYMQGNPCVLAKKKRRQEEAVQRRNSGTRASKKVGALTDESREKLLRNLEGTGPLAVAAMLAEFAGLRRGEVCGLQWRNVDLDNGTLTVDQTIQVAVNGTNASDVLTGKKQGDIITKPGVPKSRASERTILLADELATALRERASAMKAECMALGLPTDPDTFGRLYVTGGVDGSYRHPNTVSREWHALASSLNLRTTTGAVARFHDLRHDSITLVVNDPNTTIHDAQLFAGHEHASVTADMYGEALTKNQTRVKAALDSGLRRSVGGEVLQLKTGTDNN